METTTERYLSFEEAGERLKAPPEVFQALLVSGLLGHFVDGKIPARYIEDFERFGTQWHPDLGERLAPYDNLPVAPGSLNGATPVDARSHIQLAFNEIEPAVADHGWIAQFYLRPNKLFFPPPLAFAPVGSLFLKLAVAKEVKGASLPTYVYPGPDGSLALVLVIGNPSPSGEPFLAAYDVASPLLDELSVRYDQPLPIVQSCLVGIPSGRLNIYTSQPPKVSTIGADDEILPSCPYKELREAAALYREGVSSDNPFHKFLTLYKVYENLCKVRGEWRKRAKRNYVYVKPEVIPSALVFEPFVGLTFDKVKQKLNKSFRVALAHGQVSGRTAAYASDFEAVSSGLPLIRYIAHVTIENVRATLAN